LNARIGTKPATQQLRGQAYSAHGQQATIDQKQPTHKETTPETKVIGCNSSRQIHKNQQQPWHWSNQEKKTIDKHQKPTQYQCNVKPLKTKEFIGKPLTPHPQLQITKHLQLCLLTLELYLHNPNKMQGQMNKNIFKEQEAPSHISNSASKDISRTTTPKDGQGHQENSKWLRLPQANDTQTDIQTTPRKDRWYIREAFLSQANTQMTKYG
jgi:hypothetical protein